MTGCIFIQHYPRDNYVKVAISDFGVGIPHNVHRKMPWLADSLAIKKATEAGFTTKTTPKNRGAGLDTLLYNVVKNNKGSVYIHSNQGILECTYDNDLEEIMMLPRDYQGYYPGTLLDIVFRTDTIEDIEFFEEEFTW